MAQTRDDAIDLWQKCLGKQSDAHIKIVMIGSLKGDDEISAKHITQSGSLLPDCHYHLRYMDQTRRELGLSLPALLAAFVPDVDAPLASGTYSYADLPVKLNPQNRAESRQVLNGTTHEGFPIEAHITKLPAGQMPHPPHHHAWEEILFIQTGTMEVTIDGKTSRLQPGSVIYIASNEEHSSKNVGDVASQYFVLAIGRH